MNHVSGYELIDYSDGDVFRFALRCAECGAERLSTPLPYSKSGVVPQSPGKQVVFDIMYAREKEAAMTRALSELK